MGTLWSVALVASIGASAAYTLSTDDTRVTLRGSTNEVEVLSLQNVDETHNWTGTGAVLPLMSSVTIEGKAQRLTWQLVNVTADEAEGTAVFLYENVSPPLSFRSVWRARPGRGPVEHWIDIDNLGTSIVTVGHQDSLVLNPLDPGAAARVWWVSRGGGNASIQGGVFSEAVSSQLDLMLLSDCSDGASPVPWLAIHTDGSDAETGRGLYVGWAFSGLGRIQAKSQATHGTLSLAIGHTPEFRTDIAPGETLHVPPAFVGCYVGDLDAASHSLHPFVLQKLRPPVPAAWPDPSLNYCFFGDGGGPSHATTERVLRLAKSAQDLGFEVFMPDAMWFVQPGDWRFDPNRFPDNGRAITEFVHSAGMRMGLWCAWTHGGTSQHPEALTVRGPGAHPDWFVTDVGPDWEPGPFWGASICLGSSDARDWAARKTQWVVKTYSLDYLKHDISPINLTCIRTNHRHHYGVDVGYWAALGYYEVQDKLRQACPEIVLENCSGGGHIKDYGAVARTHYTVATDTLSNLANRQSFYDSTYAFPPRILQAYTYDTLFNLPGDQPGMFFWRSAMMGAWQLAPACIASWRHDELDSARRAADTYKRWIRPVLQDAEVHHVLPRPDGQNWDGMFYWSPSCRYGILYIFRPHAPEDEKTVQLKGLDPETRYWIWGEDGSIAPGIRSGSELMEPGLAVRLRRRYTSDLVFVREESLGVPPGIEAPGAFLLGEVVSETDLFSVQTRLEWEPAPHASSYHLMLGQDSKCERLIMSRTTYEPWAVVERLPENVRLYWSVEAIGPGGRRANTGGAGVLTTETRLPSPGVVFLSDMDWVKATAGQGAKVYRDQTVTGHTIHLGGRPYPKGMWTQAFGNGTPADIVVDLSGQEVAVFKSVVGMSDATVLGSLVFQVLGDGNVIAASPSLRPYDTHEFCVDVQGVNRLILRVLNSGPRMYGGHAVWAMPRLLAPGATDPVETAAAASVRADPGS
jgi:alpha-galactosidase